MDMVQELSEMTESSTKSNEQIARETGNVLENFSSNTKEITSANERTQDIHFVQDKLNLSECWKERCMRFRIVRLR